jgi:hypothetical protein
MPVSQPLKQPSYAGSFEFIQTWAADGAGREQLTGY